jgi:hypothetical protein
MVLFESRKYISVLKIVLFWRHFYDVEMNLTLRAKYFEKASMTSTVHPKVEKRQSKESVTAKEGRIIRC